MLRIGVPFVLRVLAVAIVVSTPALGAPAESRVAFNRDIRPLLADRCFKCHGFDGKARQAELRLDTFEGLTAPRPAGVPVTPGDPGRSTLIERVESADPARRMPPPDSGLTLTGEERARLRRWVEEGAVFERHWGFVPPKNEAPPPVAHASWARNGVDRFIAAALESRGLSPSPEADRETLIRRVALDLTGLPPTPEEVDAFLLDNRNDAYERVVDRLLASPRFGERMALMWLDAARYADTNGFHHDNVRTIWPYRDWVIGAFNDNLPYDRFVIEQLAGDLLPNATVDQRVASAFCRMHNINDEGGALDEEYRVEAVADRIETVATTFMGLTFTCARCHDHKYDPITQDDYYSLYAYFNSIDERGVYGNNFEQARAYPARMLYRPADLETRIGAAEGELAAATAALDAAKPAIERELSQWEDGLRTRRGVEWVEARVESARAESGAALEVRDDGSLRATGEPKARDTHHIALVTDAVGLRLLGFDALADPDHPRGRVGLAPNGNAVVTAIRAEAVAIADPSRRETIDWRWAWADHEQPNGDYDVHNALRPDALGWALEGHNREGSRTALLVSERPFGFEGGTRVEVAIEYQSRYDQHVVGRPRVTLAKASAEVVDDFPAVASDWWIAGPFRGESFDRVYDHRFGPESATSLDRGARFEGKVGWKHEPGVVDGAVFELSGERSAWYLARSIHTPVERVISLSLGSDDAIQVFLNGDTVHANKALRGAAPDQDQVEVTLAPGDNVVVVKIINNAGPAGFCYRSTPVGDAPGTLEPVALLAPSRRDAALAERFTATFGKRRSATYAALDARVSGLRDRVEGLRGEEVPVLVMSENAAPTPTFVLTRGNYAMADETRPVSRRPPDLFGGALPPGSSDDRLGFARWLVNGEHPLTARVHVNRLWQLLFGAGIVETAEDFGRQSSWPSHLALLDWLAVRFVQSGWDQKAMIRLVVTSATYRQAAVARADASTVDPANRLLAWFPRRRLQGELVRDLALYTSGLLVERVGGPSVKPYQPPGLWREVSIGGSSNTQVFEQDRGEALYRRSLYTFWKRTSPNPQMSTFDAPTREFCVVRRGATNTPLQALVMWNDVQFVEASRKLAERTLMEADDDDERVFVMFRRATGRRPGATEHAVLSDLLAGFRDRYRDAPRDAASLLAKGESPARDQDEVELAAWTMVANAVLNLDETIVSD